MQMKEKEISTAVATISYDLENQHYDLSNDVWQLEVFRQIEKDASMVGLSFQLNEDDSLLDWYGQLFRLLTNELMHGDVRSFLYRIDVSEKKIRQIDNMSVDDLCILVLEREFRKVCIRKHFSN